MTTVRCPAVPLGRAAAWALLVCALPAGAFAQGARPSPAPSASPAGFSARAHANATATVQGTAYDATVQLGMAQRGTLTRIDVLSVQSPAFPLPPLTATVVVDRASNTLTLWSDTTRRFRTQPLVPNLGALVRGSSPSPAPSATPRPSPSPRATRSPRTAAPRGSFLRDLDVLSLSVKLTGHTTTAGIPTSGLALDFEVAKRGERAPSHVVVTTQLADDYDVFPMSLDASVTPSAGMFAAKLNYAVDTFTRGLPPVSQFVVPAGYTEAPSLIAVIFGGGSGGRPAGPGAGPSPSPTPH